MFNARISQEVTVRYEDGSIVLQVPSVAGEPLIDLDADSLYRLNQWFSNVQAELRRRKDAEDSVQPDLPWQNGSVPQANGTGG